MKGLELLICVYFFKISDASLSWSKSYTLKAVLTVPGANLSEPYEVWVNGDTGNSRVDFYNGMDKLYREWDDISEKFIYYKIHPENTKTYTSIDVCHTINAAASETKMYALNTYLPVKNFVFKHNDILNGAEAQKWEAYFLLDSKMNSSVTYTMWVQFKKTPNSDNATVPVRYIFEMKIGDNLLDYFRHDYSYYDDTEPGTSVVNKLLGIQCKPLEMAEESIDPLMEYVEPQLEQSRVNTVFHRFKKIHNKNYKDENEHFRRLNIFKNNLRYINSINRQHRSFSVGLNHLADLTDEEMLVFLGTIRYPKSQIDNSYKDHTEDISNNYKYDNDDDDFVDDDIEGDNVKARFDWREYGAITPIKDQTALCASCYAFTTAAVVESATYIARGCKNLVELSEQVLVDCTWNAGYGNLGCAGGTYEDTLDWVRTNGIPTKEEYGPYLALEGRCHIKNMTKFVTIQRQESVPGVTHIIKKALRKKGPLLASINTSPRSFTLYTGGVYNDPACRSEPLMRTHSVTLVGYGREGAQKYWLLKNSYGTGWGEQGYMKLAIEDCRCGLQNYVRAVVNSNSKIDECAKHVTPAVFKSIHSLYG